MAVDLSKQIAARWSDPDPAHVDLLKQAGIEAVLLDSPNDSFEKAAAAKGIATALTSSAAIVKGGMWPGIRRAADRNRDDETASASREPWVDANGFLVACERALHPGAVPVLGYTFDEKDRSVPFETLEAALAEARVGGGNIVLHVEPRYRAALVAGDAKAKAAWQALGRTAAWTKENAALFGRPALDGITLLVEPGYSVDEIANLMFRRGGSPSIQPASKPPAPAPDRILVLVAAALKTMPRAVWDHAAAGSVVVTDAKPQAAWKLIRKEEDRSFYSLGKGQVVAYHNDVADPSEFALDCIDLVTHRRRPARTWNANAAIPLATHGTRSGEVLMHVVNYGSDVRDEVQARVQGNFTSATVLCPERSPATVKTYRRGSATEVFIPHLARVATIRFQA